MRIFLYMKIHWILGGFKGQRSLKKRHSLLKRGLSIYRTNATKNGELGFDCVDLKMIKMQPRCVVSFVNGRALFRRVAFS